MKSIIFSVLCLALLSCKKDESPKMRFESCNLESKNTQVLKNESGTLRYTNKLGGIQLPRFSYFIFVNGQMPLEVCNMPSSVKLTEDEVNDVVFGGEMVIISPNTDAIFSTIQLSDLHFK